MAWHVTSDIDEFENSAGEFLLGDPVRNNLLLTVTESLRVSGANAFGDAPPSFGWYADTEVRAAFLRTPPARAIMSDAPVHAAESLVEVLDGVPGLAGPADTVKAFANAWRAAKGRAPKAERNSRLFRLAELTPPYPAPAGRARPVAAADRELLVEWFSAFSVEAGEPLANARRTVERRLANGSLLLWETDGAPVSLAGATNPIAGVTRVAPVYTPAPLRGRGYAGAVTAEISRRALDAGLEVVLFTDLANPTSNALYQRLGYRPVGDWSDLGLA